MHGFATPLSNPHNEVAKQESSCSNNSNKAEVLFTHRYVIVTVVSWVSTHGCSTITRDFQRTGRLPGILGAYHVKKLK